ncbi:MAG: UbiA family prenyltransferase, partial [Candidatus Aenigmarchaeota archaeon]|nr:UbiA family prenyltransferase [Candidatus Aenigmarchaeota archaeon]
FFIYSSPPLRAKEMPFAGMIVHGIFYPSLLLLAYTANSPLSAKPVLFSSVAFLFSFVVVLTQEIRDFNADKKAGFTTTALFLGYEKCVNLLRLILLLSAAVFTLGVFLYMPMYTLLLLLGSVFYANLLLKTTHQDEFFRKSVESWRKAGIIMLIFGIVILPFYAGWI